MRSVRTQYAFFRCFQYVLVKTSSFGQMAILVYFWWSIRPLIVKWPTCQFCVQMWYIVANYVHFWPFLDQISGHFEKPKIKTRCILYMLKTRKKYPKTVKFDICILPKDFVRNQWIHRVLNFNVSKTCKMTIFVTFCHFLVNFGQIWGHFDHFRSFWRSVITDTTLSIVLVCFR